MDAAAETWTPETLPAGVAGPARAPDDGTIEGLRRAMLPFLEEAAQLGDVVALEISGRRFLMVTDPLLIRDVLAQPFEDVVVGPLSGSLDPVFGNALPANYSPSWRPRRLLVGKPLSLRNIQVFADVIARHARERIATWRPGDVVKLHVEVQEMTLRMIAECLFSVDITSALDRIRGVMMVEQASYESNFGSVEAGPDAMERAIKDMDEVVFDIIERRRGGEQGDGDLLDLMLEARDDEGNALADQELRDEIVALVLAGHETSALSVTLTVAQLLRTPDWRERIVAEIDAALGDRVPTFEDVQRIPLVRMALEETLRLYPPAYMQDRCVVNEIEIGGVRIPPGTALLLPAWVVHRSPRHFADPLRYDPSRFEPEARKAIPRGAYLPFGSGPKICPGNHFALLEGSITLITLLQRAELEPVYEGEPEILARALLHPADGVPVRVVRRRHDA